MKNNNSNSVGPNDSKSPEKSKDIKDVIDKLGSSVGKRPNFYEMVNMYEWSQDLIKANVFDEEKMRNEKINLSEVRDFIVVATNQSMKDCEMEYRVSIETYKQIMDFYKTIKLEEWNMFSFAEKIIEMCLEPFFKPPGNKVSYVEEDERALVINKSLEGLFKSFFDTRLDVGQMIYQGMIGTDYPKYHPVDDRISIDRETLVDILSQVEQAN
jgi:hypothetical protein